MYTLQRRIRLQKFLREICVRNSPEDKWNKTEFTILNLHRPRFRRIGRIEASYLCGRIDSAVIRNSSIQFKGAMHIA